jgi:hypothetical protein
MSLADYSRYMRAQNGGWGFEDLSSRVGSVVAKQLFQLERKQRDVATDELIEQMAQLYQVSVEELRWHQERSRRALTLFCQAQQKVEGAITVKLRHGESLSGKILWHDIAAIALQTDGSAPPVIVQRHAVVDWTVMP